MNKLQRTLAALVAGATLLTGCAHTINLSPISEGANGNKVYQFDKIDKRISKKANSLINIIFERGHRKSSSGFEEDSVYSLKLDGYPSIEVRYYDAGRPKEGKQSAVDEPLEFSTEYMLHITDQNNTTISYGTSGELSYRGMRIPEDVENVVKRELDLLNDKLISH